MRAYSVPVEDVAAGGTVGRILCHDVIGVGDLGRVKLDKGHILQPEDVPVLQHSSGELHLIEMETGDVHEDEASLRLARAVAGTGIRLQGPRESQTHLRSTHRGALEIDTERLLEVNLLPDISVFSGFDGQPVDAGRTVGATKVTPLVVSGEVLTLVEDIANRSHPIIQVRPFLHQPVGVVVRDRLTGATRDRFEQAIHMKVGWYGSPVEGIRYVPDDVHVISDAITQFVQSGVALILAAGVNSTDPLDLTIQALERVGARTERRGVPAHPGSTCWLAYLDAIPIFGLALCGMFSTTTVLDLLLPRFLSGRPVTAHYLATLGHGGLLSKDMGYRFPAYEVSCP